MSKTETNWIGVKVNKDGRISIPKSLREYYGIEPETRVSIKLRLPEK